MKLLDSVFFYSVGLSGKYNDAMYCAATGGHLDIIKKLYELNNGYDHGNHGGSAIVSASGCGHLEVVKYLYQLGADIGIHNFESLRSAARNGHLEVVKFIHEKYIEKHLDHILYGRLKIDPNNSRATCDGVDLSKGVKHDKYDTTRMDSIVFGCADITARSNSPVIVASTGGHIEVVKYLYNNGADITALNNDEYF
jgi:ankyrin repeat protein